MMSFISYKEFKIHNLAAIVISAAALTACGGGGSADSSGQNVPSIEKPDINGGTTTPDNNGSATLPGDSCAGQFGSFGIGNWPAGCWRPFSDNSPFNRKISANPKLSTDSARLVSWLNAKEAAGPNDLQVIDSKLAPQNDYNHPTYYSTPTDPEFTIQYTTTWGPFTLPAGTKIRIPDAAKPAGGQDRHMTVVDQQKGLVYDLWYVTSKPQNGGVLKAGSGGMMPIDSLGIGTPGHATGGTAAGVSNLAGIIRAQELIDGEIKHALFTVVDCSSSKWVWPAIQTALVCDENNSIKNGTHFYLDMSTNEIDALQVPKWKKTILKAMAHYGMFVGDTSGPSNARWQIQFESGQTYTSFGHEDPLVKFAQTNGIPGNNGQYRFNIKNDVDWSRLKVLDPCVSQGSCSQ